MKTPRTTITNTDVAKLLAPEIVFRYRTSHVIDMFWGAQYWTKTAKIHMKIDNNNCYFVNLCGSFIPQPVIARLARACTDVGLTAIFKRG